MKSRKPIEAPEGNEAWLKLLERIAAEGVLVSPRGIPTLEILHANCITYDMSRPVVTQSQRKLNYKFMAAEALWILRGDNKLAPLTKHVKRMADFSDDGETLAGAYGPRLAPQLEYVVDTLIKDKDTRQATASIWKPSPEPSKDIPCTLAMTLNIRNNRLYQHVYMRSSDGWLGVPYDMFSFAAFAWAACWAYNYRRPPGSVALFPGETTISMTSSHLYERDWDNVAKVLEAPQDEGAEAIPQTLLTNRSWSRVHDNIASMESVGQAAEWRLRP